jgi:sarcosine oxidase
MSRTAHYDVIVIGVGSMGSAACYFLSRRGHKVLGLEQFDITHDRGSHTGQSRIVRKAYFEHPDYVPLLQRAYHNWNLLETETSSNIYYRTGIVYFGRPDHDTMEGIRRSSSLYNIPVENVSREQAVERFPSFRIPPDFEVLFEPDAGFVTPERAILLYTELSLKNGATIRTNESAYTWKQEGGKLNVQTDKGSYTCNRLVITAGSWASKMIPSLSKSLKVTRQLLAWIKPETWDAFTLGNFPCWFIEDPDRGMYYGFPVMPVNTFGGPIGLKLAHHHPGEPADPNHVNKTLPPGAEENIRYVLSKYIPGAGSTVLSMKSCFYTYSSDEHFIIDHLPGYGKQVTIACGFSGHGFKFVPVVGEILADLAMKGKTSLPVEFLRLNRFAGVRN